MKPRPVIADNCRWVDLRLTALRPIAAGASALTPAERQRALGFVVLEAHNACRIFLRSYYLASASGGGLQSGGNVTTSTALQNRRDALTHAVHVEKSWLSHRLGPWTSREEPTWFDGNVFIRLLNSAGCSNTIDAAAAFGIGSNALLHLTTARNFFAHRGEEAGKKLRNLGGGYRIGYLRNPADVLVTRAPSRPQTIVEDWIDDLATIFSLLPT